MSAEHQPLGDIWSELSLMPRAVVSYYAHVYGHDALHVLEWIVDHVVAQSVARRDQATLDIPDWLQEFAQTPEWNLVRYTASRVGLGSGLAAIEIVETFADKDPSFDHEAFALFEVGKEQLPRARRLVQFYADRAGHGETRALRFLVGLFTRHDADFVQADYQAFCEDNVEERVGSVSVISQLEEWSRDSGESLGLVVERCVSRFAEEDKAFRRIQFRRWLEDSYLTGLPGPVDSALVCEQMRRWLGFHREGRIAAEKGGCPFADVVSNPVRDFHDLKTIHDMYDAAEETSEDESSDDKHVALVRAVFRATWPRSESFEDYIPQEGIFAEDGVEYPAWLRFSVRFGAGALGVKVHDHQSTLHDFLFLTTTTIMNDPIKLIGAAGGNQDLADPELVFQPYFSISPFSWGKHQAVKFRVQPRADCKPESLLPPKWLTTYQELAKRPSADEQVQLEMMTILLEHAVAPVVLELAIQYADHEELCPIDNTVVEWDVPFIVVAELTVPPQRTELEEPQEANEALRFNPSSVSSAEHLPLGRLNRFRRDVYQYVAKERSPEYLPYSAPRNQRVAVVGGGVSGLCAALALSEFGYEVTVYEKLPQLGGHACTKEVLDGKYLRDPAFGAFRRRQWPNTWAVMEQLGVDPISHGQAVDWFDSPFAGWFDSSGNEMKPSEGVLREGQRFVTELLKAIDDPDADARTVGSLIEEMGLSSDFITQFFIGGVIHYFAGQPLEFYLNYPLRLIAWMWLNNADREKGEVNELFHVDNALYIQRFEAFLKGKGVHFEKGVKVRCDERREAGVVLTIEGSSGQSKRKAFGHSVLAIAPKYALEVLGDCLREDERHILSQFETTYDPVVVHADHAWMPDDQVSWKLFNVLVPAKGEPAPKPDDTLPMIINLPCNRDGTTPVLATYDYAHARAKGDTVDVFPFEHGVVTPRTQALRKELKTIQGRDGIHYCGSWSRGLTLHEDAYVTGFEAANRIMGEKRQYRILEPPVPLPEPFQGTPDRMSGTELGFGRTFESILAELNGVLRLILEDAPVTLSADTEIKSIGLSSLHFARLANSLNNRLGEQIESEIDILLLLQMETVGELAEYLLGLLGASREAATGVQLEQEDTGEQSEASQSRRDSLDELGCTPSSEKRWASWKVALWQTAWGLLLSLTVVGSGVCAWWLGQGLGAESGAVEFWVGLPLVWLAALVPFTATAVGLKWCLLGRLKAGAYPIYGSTHLKWWAVNLFLQAGQQVFWFPFQNSSFTKLLLRVLGGRIHGTATASCGGMQPTISLIDADLLTVGEGAYLRPASVVQCHLFMDGKLVLGDVNIGEHASLWARAVVEPACTVEDFGILEPHSVLTLGSRLPKKERWLGVPARYYETHTEPGVQGGDGAHTDAMHTVLGLVLFPYLVIMGLTVFWATLDALGAAGNGLRFDWKVCLAFWPALLVATGALAAFTSCWKWLVLGRLKEGSSEDKVAYRLGAVRFLTTLVSRVAILWPADLRWLWAKSMGAKIAYSAVRDVPFLDLVYADLLCLESESFLSLAATADFVSLQDGRAMLQPVTLKARAYVGAYSTVAGPTCVPSRTIIASASALARGSTPREGDVWVGAPAARVPLESGELDEASFAVSGMAVVKERALELLSQFGILTLMVASALWLAGTGIPELVAGSFTAPLLVEVAELWAWCLCLYLGALLALVPVIALDGALLRRLCGHGSEAADDGFSRESLAFTVWHILTNHLMLYALLTDLASGSLFHLFLARRMGAKIGENVYLANGSAIREFSFTRIEDGVVLNRGAALIAHSEQPNGKITMKEIHLGVKSTMGPVSYIVGGTALPAGCILGTLSRPFDGQELEPHTEYNNTPCQKRS